MPTSNPNNAQSTARFDDDRAGIRAFTRQDGRDPRAMVVEIVDACLPSKRVASAPNATHAESHVYGIHAARRS